MAGVLVIIASLLGFAGSLTFWTLGTGISGAIAMGYGAAALVCMTLVLRQAKRIDPPLREDYSAFRSTEPRHCEPRALPARH